MLTDSVTGGLREVDVVIEAQVAGHAITISVECRDEGRRQSVEWVDQAYGKHLNLPTDHLVLVSNSGFTAHVLSKARAYKIHTVVPGELTDEDAAKIAAQISKVRRGRLEIVRVSKVSTLIADIGEPITLPDEAQGMPVFLATGRHVALMRDIIKGVVSTYDSEQIFAQASEGRQEVRIDADHPRVFIDELQQSLFLRIPAPENRLSQLTRISLTVDARYVNSDYVPLRPAKYQDTVYSWGELILEGRPSVVVAVTVPGGQTNIRTASL